MLQHVQAHHRVEALGDQGRVHRREPQPPDGHVAPAREALAQPAQVVVLGVREHETLAVDQKRGHVADAGADLEHSPPDPGAQALEHPPVVPGRGGHALERRGAELVGWPGAAVRVHG